MPDFARNRKGLPPKYFYDLAGSALFDRITQLPEYYPTRSEIGILQANAPAIASLFPQNCALIEFGGGSSRKARILLGAAATVEAYVPVDISGDFLQQDAAQLRRDFPHLGVYPLVEDFTKPFTLPPAIAALPRVGFFPGSTIGNFEPHEACKFLRHAGGMLGAGAVFVIGVDLVKDTKILYDAYNDAEGVTAKFNLNLLARINRELGADFNLGAFEHHAFYNSAHNRIEMHLASTRRQKVRLNGATDRFPRRRDHPHREQLQIHHRFIPGAGPRQRLVAAQGVDGRSVQRSRAGESDNGQQIDGRRIEVRFILSSVVRHPSL